MLSRAIPFVAVAVLGCASAPAPSAPPRAGKIIVRVDGLGGDPSRADVRVESGADATPLVRHLNGCSFAVFADLPYGEYSVSASGRDVESDAVAAPVRAGADTNVRLHARQRQPTAAETSRDTLGSCIPPRPRRGTGELPKAWYATLPDCVVLRCTVTIAGDVRDCRALEPPTGVTAEDLAVFERRKYDPMMCDGKPVEAGYTFRISFNPP